MAPLAARVVLVVDVGMVLQSVQDRTFVGRSPGRARRRQPLQRALHALKAGDLLLDESNLRSGLARDRIAGGAVADSQTEQLLDLLQREAQVLRVLDEAEPRRLAGPETRTSPIPRYRVKVCRPRRAFLS